MSLAAAARRPGNWPPPKSPLKSCPAFPPVIAGPSYAGIPLTHRDYCSSFTVVTGHEDPAKEGPEVDWAHVAQAPGTKVVLMGVTRVKTISDALIAHGMPDCHPGGDDPLGHHRAPADRSVGTLRTIAEVAEKAGFKPPGPDGHRRGGAAARQTQLV